MSAPTLPTAAAGTPPGLDPGPAPAAGPSRAQADRPLVVTITALLVVLLITQRVVVPVGEASIFVALPLGLVAVGVLLLMRRLQVDRVRMELFALAGAALALAALVASWAGSAWSTTSLLLLLVLWAPWVLRVRSQAPVAASLRAVARGFVATMVVLAVIGALELVAQLVGVWAYEDYVATLVPPAYLTQSFNIDNPLAFGSDVIKSSAFVFLEPSYFSQACALAIVVGLVIGARWWWLLLLACGLASAVSGTGILLLAFGLVLVAVRARSALKLPQLLALVVMGVVVVVATPVGPLLAERTGEVGQSGTSGSLRFVQPYTEAMAGLDAEPSRYLVGAGPGGVDRLLLSDRGGTQSGSAVVYTPLPKLVFEYGLLAGGAFALFMVVAITHRMPWRVVPGTVAAMLFVLSGSLLIPPSTVLAWALTCIWADPDGPRRTGSRRLLARITPRGLPRSAP